MAEKSIIYIGSDHAGFEMKSEISAFLRSKGFEVRDVGPEVHDGEDDYPDYAKRVCVGVRDTGNRGILVCGSGQGMDRVANKFRGIYASVCWNEESARIAKEHGDINVLCLAGRMTKTSEAERIVGIWLDSPFSGDERHVRRIRKIKDIEEESSQG